jgi:hypothetical protein
MSDPADECSTTDDDHLPLSITHARDIIAFAGKVEQDYRFLTYRFKAEPEEIEARMYLDDPWAVSIVSPIDNVTIPHDVLAYLQKRFRLIRQPGGPDGYIEVWSKPSRSP